MTYRGILVLLDQHSSDKAFSLVRRHPRRMERVLGGATRGLLRR